MEIQRNAEKGARRSAGSRTASSVPSRTLALRQGLSGVVVPKRQPREAPRMPGAAGPRLSLTC